LFCARKIRQKIAAAKLGNDFDLLTKIVKVQQFLELIFAKKRLKALKPAILSPVFISISHFVIQFFIFSCRNDIFPALVRKLIFRQS